MGFVGDMFDSSKGAGFRASSAPLQKAVTDAQTNQAYENTQSGLAQQQAFVNALQAQNGIQNQSNVYNQLQNVAAGQGPNPAQAMLAQATSANTANQAALMAGQRGSSSNAGLIARQAAMQGGANQQNAIGQGATMQANQSLGALGQMGSLASQQVGQQQTGLSNYNQFAQGQQQNLLNAVAQYNSANVGMQSNVNNVNASMAQGNQKFQQDFFNKGVSAVGSAAMPTPAAHGGMIQGYAEGGSVEDQPISEVGRQLNPLKMAQGGMPQNMKAGGKVPGQGNVPGDSYANDTVPAILSPKEIVIPRSITMGQNAGEMAKQFVENELRKQHFAEGGTAQPTININVPQAGAQPQSPPIPSPPAKQPPQSPVIAQNEPQVPQAMEPQVVAQPAVTEQKQVPQGPQNYQIQAPQTQSSLTEQLPQSEEVEAPVRAQIQGIEKEAQAKSALGKEEAKIAQNYQAQQQKLQQQQQQQYTDHLKEVENVTKDYQAGHINPNRVYENMSAFGKVRTAIGLILGGLGSQNGVNPAMQFLQSQIDRDIEAQKQDLDKNNNLLAANFKKFGNMQDAQKMTQAMQYGIYSTQLLQAAAKSKDPIEMARAQQAAGQLQAQIEPALREIKVRNTLLGQNNPQANNPENIAVAARFLAPKEMQKEALKEVGEYQGMQKAQDHLLAAFDKLDQLNTVGNRFKHVGFEPASVKAIRDPLVAGLSKETAGRFTETDAKFIESLFPAPGDTATTVADKKQQLQNIITQKMNFPTLKSIGINVGPKEYANKNVNAASSYQTAKR